MNLTMSHQHLHHHSNNNTIDRLRGDRPFQQQQQVQLQQQAFVTTSTTLLLSSIRSSLPSPSLASATTTTCRRRQSLTSRNASTAFIPSSSTSASSLRASCFSLRFNSHAQRHHHHYGNQITTTTTVMQINVGDRVRVLDKGIVMYHFPGKQNEAVAVAGMTGEVIKDISVQKDVKVSTTAPYVVRLDGYPKLRTHFAESELEVLPPASATDDSSTS